MPERMPRDEPNRQTAVRYALAGSESRLFTSYSQSVDRKSSAVTATTKGNRATWWLWGDLRAVSGMDRVQDEVAALPLLHFGVLLTST